MVPFWVFNDLDKAVIQLVFDHLCPYVSFCFKYGGLFVFYFFLHFGFFEFRLSRTTQTYPSYLPLEHDLVFV